MNKIPLFKAIVIILILFLSMVLIFFTAKEILIWKDIYSVYGAVGSFMLSLLCLAGVRRLIAPPVLPNDLKIVFGILAAAGLVAAVLIGYALYGQFSNANCFGIGSYQNGMGCMGGLLWTATVLLMQPIVMATTVIFSVLILTRLYVESK